MAAVYSSPQAIKGAFRADKLAIQFGPFVSGMLVQNIQFSFSQMVSMLFELGLPENGASNVYLIAGRAQGAASVARVIGPLDIGTAFLTQFGDVCRAADNTITFSGQAGCAGNQSKTYTLTGCVVNQLGMSVTAQETVVNQQLSMTYVNLDVR